MAALCAGLVAAWSPMGSAAWAAPADPAAEAAPVAAELAQKYGLPGDEADALRTEVAVHLERGGDAGSVRNLAEAAASTGCREGCLAAALAAVNRAVWLGHAPDESRKLVIRALKDAARAGGPGTLAERMRARMERFHRQNAGS